MTTSEKSQATQFLEKIQGLERKLVQQKESDDVTLMDYQNGYLQSKLWKKIRRRILKRDKRICVFCGAAAELVHHRNYERETLEGKSDNALVSLCTGCHSYIHFDDSGIRRTSEEADRILLEKNPPTQIPDPILDLRLRYPYPKEWERLNGIQRKAWLMRNNDLRRQKWLAQKEVKDSVERSRKNRQFMVENETWITLRQAIQEYKREDEVPANVYSWYRTSAMRNGRVHIGTIFIKAKKIKNTWCVKFNDVKRAIKSHRNEIEHIKQMTEDFKNHIFHGKDGEQIKTEWGFYEKRGPFRYLFHNLRAYRMRKPDAWYCISCECYCGEDEGKGTVSCPRCGITQCM